MFFFAARLGGTDAGSWELVAGPGVVSPCCSVLFWLPVLWVAGVGRVLGGGLDGLVGVLTLVGWFG